MAKRPRGTRQPAGKRRPGGDGQQQAAKRAPTRPAIMSRPIVAAAETVPFLVANVTHAPGFRHRLRPDWRNAEVFYEARSEVACSHSIAKDFQHDRL
jgi:hypothetical protein